MQRSLVSAIIASHATEPAREGEICKVRVDFAFANDITAAPAVAAFGEMGADRVFASDHVGDALDFFALRLQNAFRNIYGSRLFHDRLMPAHAIAHEDDKSEHRSAHQHFFAFFH